MTTNYNVVLTLQLAYILALVIKVSIKKVVNIQLLPLDRTTPGKLYLYN